MEKGINTEDDEEPGETETMIINEVDGLPSMHSNYSQLDIEFEEGESCKDLNARTLDELVHDEDLPMSIILTNIDPLVFTCEELKADIEKLCKKFGEVDSFQYFKSFRRMRVNFTAASFAAHARIKLHQKRFGETDISCYFAQSYTPIGMEDQYLHPPALTKQHLISPPASPPVGWEPRSEGEPLVNHDLLAAISNLTPGSIHELHRGGPGQPGIVVHVCEAAKSIKKSTRMEQTRCTEL
ncbi:protein sarah isoform X2 [Belonocnema kinseyi]|nr:protein sarah isoform X2 [Belonocnema kinseyi]XP_033210757.1 protein sarah isoform X2 [Belonocnema kinseyi]XP_033210759.1 protein sarah isoform X2 [Belonocnema kinseyi]XP_033210760.1 protein sarah isoform X2 [Belonocnema kinseyi]XP_033210761.1 protein sarah isoform X2 [Belonocnema kinseyi]XP_033210762.1 protein sarah isoform X2 [Belonocnema kinseyi]